MKIPPSNFRFLLILMAAGLLSACAPSDSTPTPTAVSVEAIYTSAAQTLMAQFSQTAAANPTATVTPTATITSTGTITPTKALVVQYIAPPAVIVSPTTSGTPGPTPTATFGAVGCNNSAFLADITVPDGTTMAAGKSFTKTWSIQNTGTCSWTFDYKFTFNGGALMGSDTFKIRRTVGPNTGTQISATFTAPTNPGTYTSYWRMADDKGVLFGVSFSLSIKVAGSTFTPTVAAAHPSATPTLPAPTNTSVVPSNTPLPSDTPVPSDTPIPPSPTP